MAKIHITDTILRDAHQSLAATRMRIEDMLPMAEKLGLDSIISPEKLIADVLISYARALQNSLGSNIETLYKLMDGKVEALEFKIKEDSRLIGIPIKEMKIKQGILIAGITRANKKTIIPSGDDCIMQGDRVIILSAKSRIAQLSDILR